MVDGAGSAGGDGETMNDHAQTRREGRLRLGFLTNVPFTSEPGGARRVRGFKFRPVFPAAPCHLLPIIHTRAFQLCIIQLKAEWLDQVQDGFRGGA